MALALHRRRRGGAMISVVSLIDVLMILLIFFMVTSTYLDLDMVPAVEPTDTGAESPGAARAGGGSASVLLVRIGPDGLPAVQGRSLPGNAFADLLRTRLQADPLLQIVLFPSPGATMQALVTAMDAATVAGATRLKVIRLEAEG